MSFILTRCFDLFINGLDIAYPEAGDPANPKLVPSNGPDVDVVLAMANDPMLQTISSGNALASVELGGASGKSTSS
jgi:hypothetical protein